MKDVIDIVIIGKGLNYTTRIDFTDDAYEYDGTRYKIDRSKLFITPRNALSQVAGYVRRIRNVYRIVFREGSGDAVGLPPVSRKDPSSDILYIAERSDALKKGLQDLFSTSILSRKAILFIVIMIVVGVVGYLYSTDQLPNIKLPSL